MKKKKSKIIWIILIIIVIFIGGMIIYLSLNPPVIHSIENIDFTTIPDGSFTGYADNGIISVSVSVTVADERLTDILILEHQNGLGRRAEAIVEDVIDEQSLDVDVISSATYSSNTILKAIENALIYQMED